MPETTASGPRASDKTQQSTEASQPSSSSSKRNSELELEGLSLPIRAPAKPRPQAIVAMMDREFTLLHFASSKNVGGNRLFEVCWAPSVVMRSMICVNDGGTSFVLIEGKEYSIERYEKINTGQATEICEVWWMNTWKAETELENAREMIQEFDQRQAEEAARSSAHTSTEDFTPTPEASSRASTETVGAANNPAAKIPILKFQPVAGVEYTGQDVRDIIIRTAGYAHPALQVWKPHMYRRPLMFRPHHIKGERHFNLMRMETVRAAFATICGEEQIHQCECCLKELGPFVNCVVAAGFRHGACSNCACSGTPRRCNFHRDSVSVPRPSTIDALPTPPSSSSPDSSPPPSSPSRQDSPDLGEAEPGRQTQPSPELGSDSFVDLGSSQEVQSPRSGKGSSSRSSAPPLALASSPTPVDQPSRRSSKRRFISDPQSESSDASEDEDEAGQSQHLSKKSRTIPMHIKSEGDEPFCWATAISAWYSPSFRHLRCGAGLDDACLEHDPYGQPWLHASEAVPVAGRTTSGFHFKPSDATDSEVRFIMSKCPCEFTESFYEAWESWKHKRTLSYTMETFLSRYFSGKLNEAVDRFCVYRIERVGGKDVIVLD